VLASVLAATEKTNPKDLVITDRPAGSGFVVTDTTRFELLVQLHGPVAAFQQQLETPSRKSRHVSRYLDDVDCALCK